LKTEQQERGLQPRELSPTSLTGDAPDPALFRPGLIAHKHCLTYAPGADSAHDLRRLRVRPDAGVRGRCARRGLSEWVSPRRRPKRKRGGVLAGAIQAVVSLTPDDAKQPRIHAERITIEDFVVWDVSAPSEHEARVIKSR
jgi:hypothetical protein